MIGRARVRSSEMISSFSNVRSAGAISNIVPASSRSSLLAVCAAARTAGAIEASVIEPPEAGPWADQLVSPHLTVNLCGAMPSRSAAIIAAAVRTPVPRSWMPIDRTGRASRPRRISA